MTDRLESRPPEGLESPVFAHARRLAPGVTVGKTGWTAALGLGAATLLGAVVFLGMQADRAARARAADQARGAPPATAPTSSVPPRPVSAAAPTAPAGAPPPLATALTPTPSPPRADPVARRRLPALVVDFSAAREAAAAPAQAPAAAGPGSISPAADEKLSADERFAQRIGATGVDTAEATRLADPSRLAPQGTVIPAVLETAIDSDLPGFARAVVSRDVRGFDGTRVLIPRGSKLIGQYRSGVADGQTRVFVIWSRILTPEGVSVEIGSPGSDPQGRGGLTGEVNNHFFKRFGASILLSILSGGIEAAAATQNATTAIVIGSPTQAANLGAVALQKQIDIPPTIRVLQGEPIRVFVARDLDFTLLDGSPTPAP